MPVRCARARVGLFAKVDRQHIWRQACEQAKHSPNGVSVALLPPPRMTGGRVGAGYRARGLPRRIISVLGFGGPCLTNAKSIERSYKSVSDAHISALVPMQPAWLRTPGYRHHVVKSSHSLQHARRVAI
jgi:hypothetical protein